MTRRNSSKQSHLADPLLSYKSVRFHGTPVATRSASIEDQSTLSQFGFTPTSASSTSGKQPKRKLIPYGKRGVKRKSLNFDDLKEESPEAEVEEEESPIGKKRKVRNTHPLVEDEPVVKQEPGTKDVGTDGSGSEGEQDWQPEYAPKRRGRGPTHKAKKYSSVSKNKTLTQMYPVYHTGLESEYEEDDDEQDEIANIKEEPSSEDELLCENITEDELEMEDEQLSASRIKMEEPEKENIPEDREDSSNPGSKQNSISGTALNPRTPKKRIPNVVPSSYTPPVTPLSPLRHSQLDAIYKSPSVQRLWRMKGLDMPWRRQQETDLATVGEEHNNPTKQNSESMSAPNPQDKPNGDEKDSPTEIPVPSFPRKPDFIRNQMVPSSQWWEREETWSSTSIPNLETIHEVNSQPELQVQSSGTPAVPSTNVTPRALRIAALDDVDVIPESPLKKKDEAKLDNEISSPTTARTEPLLRDSSNLRTSSSSLGRENSTVSCVPNSIQEESQQSEVSTRSVDRQLLFESDDYTKSAVRIGEMPKEDSDPDRTVSQSPISSPKDPEKTPVPIRRPITLASKAGSFIPLLPQSSILPPSSPIHNSHSNIMQVPSTPESSRDTFHSTSSTPSASPIVLLRESSPSSGPPNHDGEDPNETLDLSEQHPRGVTGETHTQWKLRMFGPSQAVPTISQILPKGMLDDDDDDDEEEEL